MSDNTQFKPKPIKVAARIDQTLVFWMDKMIESKRFANRTHAIELGLQLLRETIQEHHL
ncbi:MAG: hypothetical protein ACLPY5_03315 [Candidatus Bathyarchaeia archaeon]